MYLTAAVPYFTIPRFIDYYTIDLLLNLVHILKPRFAGMKTYWIQTKIKALQFLLSLQWENVLFKLKKYTGNRSI